MNLNKKNNIRLKIQNTLTSNGSLLIVDKGRLLGEDFSNNNSKNFKLTLVKMSGTNPIQMEIVEVISKTGNNLTISRAVEKCPLNYNAEDFSQNSYEFNIGDFVYQNITAEEINQIGNEILNLQESKIDITDISITKMGNNFNSGGKLVKLENNGKLPILDGSNLINIKTDNFNFSIDYIAGENISGNNFVRRGNNRKINIDGLVTYAPYGQTARNIQEKLYIKKIPSFFYEIQLLGSSSGYNGMKIVFYKNSNFTDKLAESTSLNYEYISSGNKHIYKFGNFNIFDKDFIIENKIIYWRMEGNNNASFYYSEEYTVNEYFDYSRPSQDNRYFHKIIFGKNEDESKVYKAISKYSLENEDIIGFVKNGGNTNQNIRVITDGYIDGQNIPLNQRNVFLGKNGGVTQENTGVKIGEKVNNNIFKFIR